MTDTEGRSEATRELDRVSVTEGLALLTQEFQRSFTAFSDAAPQLAPIVDAVVDCVRRQGTVHLFGAGTSGRLAALDAAEIPPTFGLPPTVFRPHLAGGLSAMTIAVENAEDDEEAGIRAGCEVKAGDVGIGVTASGRTPFVLAALRQARERGSFTALIACNPPAQLTADCQVTLETGPEPIAGSTRLNAATAQKLALNAISTLAMVRLGRTYSNLMVCLQPTNAKLRHRLERTLGEISGAASHEVAAALAKAGHDGDIALAMLMKGWDVDQARAALSGGTPLRVLIEDHPS